MSNGMTRDIDLHDSLKYPKYGDKITTNQEISSVFTDRENCLKINKIEGRTIVNLLGADGDCEDVSKWGAWRSTATLDSTNKVFGNNGIKITVTSGQELGSIYKNGLNKILDTSKYYCISSYMKNLSGLRMYIQCDITHSGGTTNIFGNFVTDTSKFNSDFIKLNLGQFSGITDITLSAFVYGLTTNTNSGVYDAIMIEEITQADYNNPNFVPSPYVSNDMSVGDVVTRVKSRSKNMINLVQGSYNIDGSSNNNITRLSSKGGRIDVKPNTTYNVSINSPLKYIWNEFDENLSNILVSSWSSSASNSFSFTTNSKTRYITLGFKIDDTTTMYADNYQIMMNEGSEPLAYEPYEDTFAPIQYPLRALPSGVKDTIEGNKHIKRVERMVLDGSLSWEYFASATGYKRVRCPLSNFMPYMGRLLKYNNKDIVLQTDANLTGGDRFFPYINGYVYLDIPSSDSGWGDSYTPTSDEIKAYFNGWKMFDSVSNPQGTGVYNGIGNKYWAYRLNLSGSDVVGNYFGGTSVLPTTIAPNFTPYRLYYQLTIPVPTELNLPNLVAYPQGNLIMESDSQSWVRPTITYQLAENEKANIDEVMKGLSDARRLSQKNLLLIGQSIQQAIPTSVDVKLVGTDVITPTHGVYMVTVQLGCIDGWIGNKQLQVYLNNNRISNYGYNCEYTYTSNTNTFFTRLKSGDVLSLGVYQNSGSSKIMSGLVQLLKVGD